MRGAVFALLCMAPPLAAQPRGQATTVSLVEGTAQVRRGPHLSEHLPGVAHGLPQGSVVKQGDWVETAEDSRLELRLPDGSALRLGPNTRVALDVARFERAPASGRFAARLFSGTVWVRVIGVAAAAQRFQIATAKVVASVSGTTLRVDAHPDLSVLIRVYSGSVMVRPNAPNEAPAENAPRRAAPRQNWEKKLGQRTQILISADGTAGLPAPFSEADEKDDDWSAWNRKRDEQGK
ncbi:MAG: FecR domain-containing protein [Myxococcales bacterium]